MVDLITMQVKNQFFDRAGVITKIGKQKAARLRKAGALVRRSGRDVLGRAVKRKTAPNAPGKPPRVRSTQEPKSFKTILYALNSEDSVMVGPVGLNTKQTPGLHEKGGQASMKAPVESQPGKHRGNWNNRAKRKRVGRSNARRLFKPTKRLKTVYFKMPKRPFMQPALKRKASQLPKLFEGLFK